MRTSRFHGLKKCYKCSLDDLSIPHGLGYQDNKRGIARISTPDGWLWTMMHIACKSRDEARGLLKANAGPGSIQRTFDNQFFIYMIDYFRSLGVPDAAPDFRQMQVLLLGGLYGMVAGLVGVWKAGPGESGWLECLRFVGGSSPDSHAPFRT